MAIPIPRISWGWPVVITEDVNDLVPLTAALPGYSRSGYVGKVAAGSYSTPESLISAINAAVGEEDQAGEPGEAFGDEASIFGDANAGGRVTLVVGPVDLVGVDAWTPSTPLGAGAMVSTSGGLLYRVAVSGTSGGAEPVGDANPVADGSATLSFLGRLNGITIWFDAPPAWIANAAIDRGDLVATPEGRMYVCDADGTTGATAPAGETSAVTDGTATLRYSGRVEAARGLGTLLGFGAANVSADLPAGVTSNGHVTFVASSPLTLWSPDVPVRADVEREFESIVTQVETAGGQNKTTRWTPDSLDGRRTYRRVRFAYLKPERVFTDVGGAVALETFWRGGSIGRFTYSPDRDNPTVGAQDYFLRETSAREFKPRRMFDGVELYEIELEMGLYTP